MPDLVLDYHRLKTPIDHPLKSVTREHLEYPTEDVELVYLTAIGKTRSYAAENVDHTSFLATVDPFTDKAVDAWCHAQKYVDHYKKIGVVGRIIDAYNWYLAGFAIYKASADFGIVKSYHGTETILGTEAVDLASDAAHHVTLSISGSTIKGYRGGELKITVTDTNIGSGGYGVKFSTTSGWLQTDAGYVYATARLVAPMSPGVRALLILEVEAGNMFASDKRRADTVEGAPMHMMLDAKMYDVLKSKGYTDEEIEIIFGKLDMYVDVRSVTWGAFELNPASPTNIVAIYGTNPYNPSAVEAQVEYVKRRGLRVFKAPSSYREATELYELLRNEYGHWLAGKDNFAYQILGHEEHELFAVADFYYGELVEHRTHYHQLKRVPDWEMRRTLERWLKRLEKVSVLTEERDKHLNKLSKVMKLGW